MILQIKTGKLNALYHWLFHFHDILHQTDFLIDWMWWTWIIFPFQCTRYALNNKSMNQDANITIRRAQTNSLEPFGFKIRAGGKDTPQVEVARFQGEQMQLGSVHPQLSSSHSISENRYTQMITSYKFSKDPINLETCRAWALCFEPYNNCFLIPCTAVIDPRVSTENRPRRHMSSTLSAMLVRPLRCVI